MCKGLKIDTIDLSRTRNGKEVLLKVIKEEKLFKAYKQKISTAPAKLLETGNVEYSDQSKLNSAIQAALR